MPSPATTLMMEDALQLMVRKDGKYGPRYEKSRGFIDMGSHSCFGDFPHDYLPEGVKDKLKTAKQSRTQMLPRIHSAPGLSSAGPRASAGTRTFLQTRRRPPAAAAGS